MEIERLRYAAGQAAGSQARPRSPIPSAAGLNANVAVKMAEKEAALTGVKAEVVNWIQTVSGSPMSDASFAKWLHDGKVLCALINIIKPGAIPDVNESTLAVKQMFMNAARDVGTPESSTCGAPDLYGEMNLGPVVQGIYALRKAVQVNVPESRGPKLDSPSADVNQGTGQQWHDDSRKERWADLSDCTTDAGSHSDLDKDAAEQELIEKMRDSWPRMLQEVLEAPHAEPGQKRWTALVAAWRDSSGPAP